MLDKNFFFDKIVIDSCRILLLHGGVFIQPKYTMKVTALLIGRLSWFFYVKNDCISIIIKLKFGGNNIELEKNNES